MNDLKILICGGRTFLNYDVLSYAIYSFLKNNYYDNIEIISGHCQGADTLGEEFANNNNYKLKIFPANWAKFGRGAGIKRNIEMVNYLNESNCDKVVFAFWDGKSKGTKFTIDYAEKFNINVIKVLYEDINNQLEIFEGIRKNNDEFYFDFNNDNSNDLVNLNLRKINCSKFYNNIYFYQYKFNAIDKNDRDELLKLIKNLNENDERLIELINRCLENFYESLNGLDIDCIIKTPSRSPIVNMIVKQINDNFQNINIINANKINAVDVDFDWELLKSKCNYDDLGFNKLKMYLSKLLKTIRKDEYFSISKIPPRYRQYLMPFLKINNDVKGLNNVLIIDDILTSGQTILTVEKELDNLGFNGNIYILSLFKNR